MRELAKILPLETAGQFQAALEQAVALLKAGEVVALPTETVYGLAADALRSSVVEKIFQIKGRPSHNPLIVHVSSLEMARSCASDWPDSGAKLAAAFWPGPLTVVVRKKAIVPSIVTAGGDTVALRWPSHPFMQAVIREAGFPLAAPSANLSGEISPTCAEHVRRSLETRLRLIVDGGKAQVGIESTVVDCTGTEARVLRPGIISASQIAAVLNLTLSSQGQSADGSGVLRSPGLLDKHYAPKARLMVSSWEDENDLLTQTDRAGFPPAETHVIAHSHIPLRAPFGHVSVIPLDAEAYARALYAELHQRDEANARLIIVEQLPDTPEWEGINDRLRRAGMR